MTIVKLRPFERQGWANYLIAMTIGVIAAISQNTVANPHEELELCIQAQLQEPTGCSEYIDNEDDAKAATTLMWFAAIHRKPEAAALRRAAANLTRTTLSILHYRHPDSELITETFQAFLFITEPELMISANESAYNPVSASAKNTAQILMGQNPSFQGEASSNSWFPWFFDFMNFQLLPCASAADECPDIISWSCLSHLQTIGEWKLRILASVNTHSGYREHLLTLKHCPSLFLVQVFTVIQFSFRFSHGLTLQLNAVSVVGQAIQNRIGKRCVTYAVVPA